MATDKESEVVALTLKQEVEALQVVDQVSHDYAQALNKKAYEAKKAFHEWFDPIDDASKKQRQATIAQGKKVDEPFDMVIKLTGSKCAAWIRQEQARIAEEKRKAEDLARKEAEESAIRAAEALQKEGLTAAADAVLEAPIVAPKVVMEEVAKDTGVSYRDIYSAEVIDFMALVKAVASGTVPAYYLTPSETALNQWARTSKGTESIPGVKVNVETIQSRRL
jgi:hypothetical protein